MSTINTNFNTVPAAKPAIAPAKTDAHAPNTLVLKITDAHGNEWGTLIAPGKVFSTGSAGFYASGKLVNPKSGESYQVGSNITLIGSSPDAAKKAAARAAEKAAKAK